MTPARPKLTFFVELELEPLEELFRKPDVVPFLAAQGCAVSMGLLDLSPRRAAVVRRLESNGIPVTGWLLLDVEDGYWLNADNADRARERWRETAAWAERWMSAMMRRRAADQGPWARRPASARSSPASPRYRRAACRRGRRAPSPPARKG